MHWPTYSVSPSFFFFGATSFPSSQMIGLIAPTRIAERHKNTAKRKDLSYHTPSFRPMVLCYGSVAQSHSAEPTVNFIIVAMLRWPVNAPKTVNAVYCSALDLLMLPLHSALCIWPRTRAISSLVTMRLVTFFRTFIRRGLSKNSSKER